ncbi:transcription factor bHLH18 [Lathyrus oleraceus]|nr:transcription factor bHLH18-like [Pisum sativum]
MRTTKQIQLCRSRELLHKPYYSPQLPFTPSFLSSQLLTSNLRRNILSFFHTLTLTLYYTEIFISEHFTLKLMEESGEKWPSDLEKCDDVILEDGESESVYDEKLLALSAAIGLKKTKLDKASILEKTKHYVEQLQERIKELEQNVGFNNICSNNCRTGNNILPDVKVKVLQKEILLTIHCQKQKSVMLKILTHLESLNLLVQTSNILEFGKFALEITIVAQMGDGYNITMEELLKSLTILIMTK